MKRLHSTHPGNRTGDIKRDLTEKQLAGIGSAALAYNEAEVLIDALLSFALGLWPEVAVHLTSRINGIDGKIELAKIAVADLGASDEVKEVLASSFGGEGKSGFSELKRYRDAIVHARISNASAGIAITPGHRGKINDILLTTDALDGLYGRLVCMRNELSEACNIAIRLFRLRKLAATAHEVLPLHPPSAAFYDLTKSGIEQDIQGALFRYREHQKRRLSLPPLPDFPSESELQQSHQQWLKDQGIPQMDWMKPFQAEPKMARFPPFGPPSKK